MVKSNVENASGHCCTLYRPNIVQHSLHNMALKTGLHNGELCFTTLDLICIASLLNRVRK